MFLIIENNTQIHNMNQSNLQKRLQQKNKNISVSNTSQLEISNNLGIFNRINYLCRKQKSKIFKNWKFEK